MGGGMRWPETKIYSRQALAEECRKLRKQGKTVVFTNGCFDVLHAGHLDYLLFARKQGDRLMVGLNSDASVRRNKGEERPVVNENERQRLLAALEAVDGVTLFDEDEPRALIETLLPDVLVKGADWSHYVSGREAVEANGGRVVLAPLTPGRSTTDLIRRLRERT
jgi:D-glycero-beta-D-manno-heptose 1-phosphate adenylyltransferase